MVPARSILLAALALGTVSGPISMEEGSSPPLRGFLSFGGGGERGIVSPIAGDAVTLEEARGRAPYSIPLLPQSSLPQVCDEGDGPLRLLQAWSNYSGGDPGHQTALTYNHGIYLQLEPLAAFNFGDVPELPAVEEWFPPDDYPEGLITSGVRGHVAWVGELDQPVTCPGPPEPIWYTPGPQCPNGMCTNAPPPQEPGAFMFDPTETAVLTWLERGVVLELVGPYPSETLKSIAEGINWLDQTASS